MAENALSGAKKVIVKFVSVKFEARRFLDSVNSRQLKVLLTDIRIC